MKILLGLEDVIELLGDSEAPLSKVFKLQPSIRDITGMHKCLQQTLKLLRAQTILVSQLDNWLDISYQLHV